MLEKLIKGRYLTFVDPKPNHKPGAGTFWSQPRRALTITQSVREKLQVPKWDSKKKELVREGPQNQKKLVSQRQRVSGIAAGENTDKVHRNFQWLGYYGGAVSQVPFDNIEVLSGNFSGCWMMAYKKDGVPYVGHVGTVDDPTHNLSIQAKKAWNDYAKAHPLEVARGFNPARAWTSKESRPAKINGDGLPRIWGLVTSTQLISIYLFRGENDWDRYRIADWKVMDPEFIPQLAAI